jgi:hypothetical protein
MTYQELLTDLHAAERDTTELEAAVEAAIAAEIAVYGADFVAEHGESTRFSTAQGFIWNLEQVSWEDTDEDGTQNAIDTVADYGVDHNSLVGLFIFADTNHPNT